MTEPKRPPCVSDFTPGRFVMSWCDAQTARDPIALTQQVKYLRDGLKQAGHTPALLLVVVADGEEQAASDRIVAALDAAGVQVAPRSAT